MIAEIAWHTHSPIPLLAILQGVPVFAALLLWRMADNRITFAMAMVCALVELSLAATLALFYQPEVTDFQFAEKLVLYGPLVYHAAADGMTVLFILLASFLVFTAVVYTLVRPFHPMPQFLAMLFWCLASLITLFATLDLLWYTLVSVIQVGLAGILIQRWSVALDKEMATRRFLQFMGLGLLMLLSGTMLVGWVYASLTATPWTFDLLALSNRLPSRSVQSLVFFLLFYGMAVRMPLFPFHGWLPHTTQHGSVIPALVLLLGAKTGVYGLLRFVFPLVPAAVQQWDGYAVAIATGGIFYAALLAMMQQDLRSMIAYAVVCHHGILTIGLFTLTAPAVQGSLLLTINFGLAAWTLFFMVGVVTLRTHTVQFHRLGGLFDDLPLIAITFFVAGLSIMAMPGFPGFNGHHLLLEAAIHRFGALETIAAALSNVVAAGFLLWSFQRIFMATPAQPRSHPVAKATSAEIFLATLMIVVLLAAGYLSGGWLKMVENTSTTLTTPYAHEKEQEDSP
ncbi:MAG: NADH-quinone oxidoreductase subunit L [Magnetococcales bacterium]|nr:NADH-quinone oxidoreductase subunit L [Magnetococcales bacterium]NGZ29300.1 NADH-quinone oxidoreductase subunit L [Magnetococcales bacterium]